ncbi:MAG: hypothetical protein LZF60_80099 [Nitrospira sp.]|nr:MAG: hypothetical protein LZF60_80099 [Nitrospira sp.]
MAGQAIARGPPLLVTRQAPAHFKRRRAWRTAHTRHFAMTGFALESMGEMTFMSEVDEVRQALQTHPCDRFLSRPMVKQRLHAARLSGIHVLVTSHTQTETRNTGSRRDVRRAVAIPAVQGELTGMEGVVERDRLLVLGGGVCAAFRIQQPNKQRADGGQRDQTKTLPQCACHRTAASVSWRVPRSIIYSEHDKVLLGIPPELMSKNDRLLSAREPSSSKPLALKLEWITELNTHNIAKQHCHGDASTDRRDRPAYVGAIGHGRSHAGCRVLRHGRFLWFQAGTLRCVHAGGRTGPLARHTEHRAGDNRDVRMG